MVHTGAEAARKSEGDNAINDLKTQKCFKHLVKGDVSRERTPKCERSSLVNLKILSKNWR